jgi:hypothetical protein
MIILNFSYPLTPAHLEQIEALTGEAVERVLDVATQFDNSEPFAAQVRKLVDGIGLTPRDWQTIPLLINPPSHNSIVVALLAELHARTGHFPACIRLRPVPEAAVPRYEVAEVINLQQMRESRRSAR